MQILLLLTDLFTNQVFLSATIGWLCSQIIKALIQLKKNPKDMSRLLSGGGMPSSHTATVVGLCFGTALRYGTGGFEFPMAFFFMTMVIYDSLGVRYVTGQQNQILNHIIMTEKSSGKDPFYRNREPSFKELMGHTLPEVLAGAGVGLAAAVLVHLAFWPGS